MRLFAVKLILSYRQKYESRSKSFIFDIFFLNVHHIRTHTVFNENVAGKMFDGTFTSSLAYRNTHKLQSLRAQNSFKVSLSYIIHGDFNISLLLTGVSQSNDFPSKCVEFSVYYHELQFRIFILPSKCLISLC